MAEYLLEIYVSRTDPDAVADGTERARRAAEVLRREGTPVRFLRTMFVPEDETCFYLYEGANEQAVREAARRAGLPVERIVEAVTPAGEGAPM